MSSAFVVSAGSAETESSSSESTLSPSVLDVGEVPVNDLGSSELVELVANINQSLDRSNVDVVNTGEIKDHGLEDRSLIIVNSLDVAGLSVVPRTITKLTQKSRVSSSALLEDGLGEVVQVVRGIGVVEALSKSVDEDTRVRSADDDLRVGTVAVIKRKETSSERTLTLVNGSRAGGTVTDVGLHGSDTDNTEEATTGLEETENDDSSGHGDCGVDTVLDGAEDSDEYTCEEDDDLNG